MGALEPVAGAVTLVLAGAINDGRRNDIDGNSAARCGGMKFGLRICWGYYRLLDWRDLTSSDDGQP